MCAQRNADSAADGTTTTYASSPDITQSIIIYLLLLSHLSVWRFFRFIFRFVVERSGAATIRVSRSKQFSVTDFVHGKHQMGPISGHIARWYGSVNEQVTVNRQLWFQRDARYLVSLCVCVCVCEKLCVRKIHLIKIPIENRECCFIIFTQSGINCWLAKSRCRMQYGSHWTHAQHKCI